MEEPKVEAPKAEAPKIDAPKIEAALKGISDKPVRFVLNTHWHGDHTHGNRVWGRSASIIAR